MRSLGQEKAVPLYFALIIHAHQPVGNFDHVLEKAYQDAYLPFLETLARFPRVRMTLHYCGALLEWMEEHHPAFFAKLRELVARGQVELLGGGFYEPILSVIPEEDRQAQLRLLGDFIRQHFGQEPRGIWLAERVWEPTLPKTLAAAGVEFTLTDDQHFLAAGLTPEELYGYYLTEHLGACLKVIPGNKRLRYMIPFYPVPETLTFLRQVAQSSPEGFIAMGDDCEKFGVWPGTHELCYVKGWLEEFFRALEAGGDWLETVTASDYLDAHPPRGRVYLPTAAYTEMTEWALPTGAQQRFEKLRQAAERHQDEDQLQFLRGGFWQNFFAKYSEANFLHKRMLYASRYVRRASRGGRSPAYRQLLRGQCNDAYWHGIFGGLYAPHLRTAVYGSLLAAERSATRGGRSRELRWEKWDYDLDGREELVGRQCTFVVWFDGNDGATLKEIDLLACSLPLVNSLRRRREAYHETLRAAERAPESPPGEAVRTIHELVAVKEAGLAEALTYDHYDRHAFRLLVFSPEKGLEDFRRSALAENAELATGEYRLIRAARRALRTEKMASLSAGGRVAVQKDFSLRAVGATGVEVDCAVQLKNASSTAVQLAVGVELVINLLAPDAPDRYLTFGSERHHLRWQGEIPQLEALALVDEYQGVRVELRASRPDCWWCVPIESVSQSEAGFERVYQGSALLPLWRLTLLAGGRWQARVVLRALPLPTRRRRR